MVSGILYWRASCFTSFFDRRSRLRSGRGIVSAFPEPTISSNPEGKISVYTDEYIMTLNARWTKHFFPHLHAHGAAVVEVDLEASRVGSSPLHGVRPSGGSDKTAVDTRSEGSM